MKIIFHNLKVALRNLMKYKLQTLISVVSIAIGIVMLALAHAILSLYRLPSIYDLPYHDRAYQAWFTTINEDERQNVTEEIIRIIKGNNGLRNAERIVAYNGDDHGVIAEFHLSDSTIRKGQVAANIVDPNYPNYIGMRSAITGKEIKVLKAGEAIIGEEYAKTIFGESDPIGAVQTKTDRNQTIPITIVDVYKTQSINDEKRRTNGRIYFCLSDSIEEYMPERYFYASALNVVLKDGSTEQQLIKEISERIKPLGLNVRLSKVLDNEDIKMNYAIRTLIYIISSLILLAAVIGFLRMQVQLFKMRRRELALRIVNGANRMNLFGLLFTEVTLSLCLAIIVALVLAMMLQDFLDKGLKTIIDMPVHNILGYSMIVGVCLLFLCGIIVWLMISNIERSSKGLAENVHRSKNHLFRNVMLSLQIVISLVFVCGTFILANGADKIIKANNVPENDYFFKKCLYLRPYMAEQPDRLIDNMEQLPNLEKMVMRGEMWYSIREIEENLEYKEKYDNQTYFNIYQTNDTALPAILGMDVQWFNSNIDRTRCLLISKKLYNRFKEFGVLDNNTLTIKIGKDDSVTLPLAGIIRKVPYDTKEEILTGIMPDWNRTEVAYLLIPKSGQYKALTRSVDETIARLEPTIINKMAFNYRTIQGAMPEMVEALRAGGWILGCVSLLICAMSIFSTIALDTRARRKDVAVRKVNGAKSHDIYRLFGKLYIVLIVLSLIIAVPLCVLFSRVIGSIIDSMNLSITLSPVMPIIFGCAIVILLIFLIVGWHIHRVMQVDPAKIIAKE